MATKVVTHAVHSPQVIMIRDIQIFALHRSTMSAPGISKRMYPA